MLSLREFKKHGHKRGGGGYQANKIELDRLITLLAEAKGKREVSLLLRSLLTNRELVDVVRRVTVAKLIEQGMTYDQITEVTGASRTTIALVNHALHSNQGVFSQILNRVPYPSHSLEKAIIARLKRGK